MPTIHVRHCQEIASSTLKMKSPIHLITNADPSNTVLMVNVFLNTEQATSVGWGCEEVRMFPICIRRLCVNVQFAFICNNIPFLRMCLKMVVIFDMAVMERNEIKSIIRFNIRYHTERAHYTPRLSGSIWRWNCFKLNLWICSRSSLALFFFSLVDV